MMCRLAFGKRPSAAAVEQVRSCVESMDDEALGRSGVGLLDHDVRETLGSVTKPALILAGSRDVLTPVRAARSIAKLLPDATFRVLPEAGHQLMQERPGRARGGAPRRWPSGSTRTRRRRRRRPERVRAEVTRLRVFLIEPWLGGSHQAWAEGYAAEQPARGPRPRPGRRPLALAPAGRRGDPRASRSPTSRPRSAGPTWSWPRACSTCPRSSATAVARSPTPRCASTCTRPSRRAPTSPASRSTATSPTATGRRWWWPTTPS